jgi:hypothetical protein
VSADEIARLSHRFFPFEDGWFGLLCVSHETTTQIPSVQKALPYPTHSRSAIRSPVCLQASGMWSTG